MASNKGTFESSPPGRKAVCTLENSDVVKGNLTFIENGNGVTQVTGTISGLEPGEHGFHIHEFGDYSAGCVSAGGHFNPQGKNHGGPTGAERHAGDLGNITSDANKKVAIEIYDNQIPLSGPNSIIGRSLVVHADADDLGLGGHPDSLTTGHAGGRVACGIIGLAKM